VKFHQMLMQHKGVRERQGFVDFYVNKIGTKHVLDDIYQVASWKEHPSVYSVKYEDLSNLSGKDKEAQRRAVEGIANFLNTTISKSQIDEFLQMVSKKLKRKRVHHGYLTNWQELFTNEDNKLFYELFGDVAVEFGYQEI